MKAIYKGECQICGRIQKLPKNLLAKHGYSVEWNMFQGVCSGSKELPYEKSCEMIKTILPGVKKQLDYLEKKKVILMQPAMSNKCFAKVWLKDKGCYAWVEGELVEQKYSNTQNTYHWSELYILFEYMGISGKENVRVENKDLLCAATELNKKYVDQKLNKTIEEIRGYYTWLTKRINNWELKENRLI